MSTIEIGGFTARKSRNEARPRALAAALAGLWSRYLKRRADRRTLRQLRRLDARTLRDMGFEPAEIYGTRIGTIGEIHGDAWKGLDH